MVGFAVAVFAGQRPEIRVETLVSQAHSVVQGMAPCNDTAAGLGAALPIVHVVLLERAGRAENAHSGEADRFLDFGRRRLVGIGPGPDFGLVWAARVPHPKRARGRPKDR